MGATILFECPVDLMPLFQGVSLIDELVDKSKSLSEFPPFDTYCWLLSLPQRFQNTLETLPVPTPLTIPYEALIKWTNYLQGFPGTKIGIVWAGTSTHLRDRYRSTNLSQWKQLLKVPGVHFFSLQKGKLHQKLPYPKSFHHRFRSSHPGFFRYRCNHPSLRLGDYRGRGCCWPLRHAGQTDMDFTFRCTGLALVYDNGSQLSMVPKCATLPSTSDSS